MKDKEVIHIGNGVAKLDMSLLASMGKGVLIAPEISESSLEKVKQTMLMKGKPMIAELDEKGTKATAINTNKDEVVGDSNEQEPVGELSPEVIDQMNKPEKPVVNYTKKRVSRDKKNVKKKMAKKSRRKNKKNR